MSFVQRMVICPAASPVPAHQEPAASWAANLATFATAVSSEATAVSSEATEVSSHATAVLSDDTAFCPPTPQALEETGISDGSLEDLILKTLYSTGETVGRDLAAALGLKFSLIEHRVEFLKNQRQIQVKGSLGFGSVSAVFGLSEAGRVRVRECLE